MKAVQEITSQTNRARLAIHLEHRLQMFAASTFTIFLILSLTTPSWRYGPFSWWPLIHFSELAGGPVAIGALNLLPLLTVVAWLAGRFLRRLNACPTRRPWCWGRLGLTAPLLGLTILGIASLDFALSRQTFTQAGGLALFWLAYLFVVNERPSLFRPLAIVALVQGLVALGQFLNQADLGLAALGELPLNPDFGGVSIVTARGQLWLRAYGLTAHPNLLGAILTVALLFLLPALSESKGRRRWFYLLAFNLGLLGLAVSFSRAAVLALIASLIFWWLLGEQKNGERDPATGRRVVLNVLLSLLLLGGLFLAFGDLFFSRVTALDTPGEARSLNQRLSDAELALELIGDHPWQGVGLGNYTDIAKNYASDAARVHNVLLFVTAELGLPGLLLVVLLGVAPFFYPRRPMVSLWLAVLVVGLFDTTLWLTANWQTALLFGLIAASQTRPKAVRSGNSAIHQ